MKEGQASRTAELVCMGRAAAHGRTPIPGFSDPTAFDLLSDESRARVEQLRSGTTPKGIRARVARVHLKGLAQMMAARTVAIDTAIRAVSSPQVVILGAGLDGRAWRMPELQNAAVFEIDHPDSQREKRNRVSRLPQAPRDVRFVPVDFERDSLGEKLAEAGHDPSKATTWVWEGVVMYLALPDIERTLAVIERASAPGSRLIVVYHRPATVRSLLGPLLRRIGEPLRSAFTPEEMAALLVAHGLSVVSDEDIATISASLSANVRRDGRLKRLLNALRIVVADRR